MKKDTVKIWTATRNSKAGFMVSEETVIMAADRNNFFAASKDGVIASGQSIVLNTTSENIRNGGAFVKMNDFTQLIPTTLVTPMPSQIPYPPLSACHPISPYPFR